LGFFPIKKAQKNAALTGLHQVTGENDHREIYAVSIASESIWPLFSNITQVSGIPCRANRAIPPPPKEKAPAAAGRGQFRTLVTMKKQDTCRQLRGIIAAIDQAADLAEKYRYEDFCQDYKAQTTITGYIRAITAYDREISTIVRVKYLLVPWKDLDALEDTISRADHASRPRILWRITTDVLPRSRPQLADVLRDMEN